MIAGENLGSWVLGFEYVNVRRPGTASLLSSTMLGLQYSDPATPVDFNNVCSRNIIATRVPAGDSTGSTSLVCSNVTVSAVDRYGLKVCVGVTNQLPMCVSSLVQGELVAVFLDTAAMMPSDRRCWWWRTIPCRWRCRTAQRAT